MSRHHFSSGSRKCGKHSTFISYRRRHNNPTPQLNTCNFTIFPHQQPHNFFLLKHFHSSALYWEAKKTEKEQSSSVEKKLNGDSSAFTQSQEKSAAETNNDLSSSTPQVLPNNNEKKTLREAAPLSYDFRVHAGKIIYQDNSMNRSFVRKDSSSLWTSKDAKFQDTVQKISMNVTNRKEEEYTLEKQLSEVREFSPNEITPTGSEVSMRTEAEREEEKQRELVATTINDINKKTLIPRDDFEPFNELDIPQLEEYRRQTEPSRIEKQRDASQTKLLYNSYLMITAFLCLALALNKLFYDVQGVRNRKKQEVLVKEKLKYLK